jgi:hypothetical protein
MQSVKHASQMALRATDAQRLSRVKELDLLPVQSDTVKHCLRTTRDPTDGSNGRVLPRVSLRRGACMT